MIKKRALFRSEDKLLLAVSGGVDSMVLWQLVAALDIPYAVAHCNFQLRGVASDADEELVRKTAAIFGVTCYVEKCDTNSYATINKVSTQMAARDLRYAWFNQLCDKNGYSKIVLAHHANDDIETFLLNMVRGTSIKGQKGMKLISGRLVRPLLDYSKEEILAYAQRQGVVWRDDSSNEQTYYKRNFVRKEIIPRLEELNPDLLQTMKRNMAKNNEIYELSRRMISNLRDEIVKYENGEFTIEKLALNMSEVGPYVLSEILAAFGFNYSRCEDVFSALNSSGKTFSSMSHRLIIDREKLVIQEISDMIDYELLINVSDKEINLPQHYEIKYFEPDNFVMDRSPRNAVLDSDKLIFPLKIRRWKEGDKFKPLGMKGQKLISDLLIDLKLSVLDKESVYVLESESQIAWVLGLRISDDFKMTKDTRRIVHFKEVSH